MNARIKIIAAIGSLALMIPLQRCQNNDQKSRTEIVPDVIQNTNNYNNEYLSYRSENFYISDHLKFNLKI